MTLDDLKIALLSFYSDQGNERVGFILPDKIVEVHNIASDPVNTFMVAAEDVIKYTETEGALALWHTHPSKDSNLSGDDYPTFIAYKDLVHLIVGNDGVRAYKFDKDKDALLEVK